MTAQFPAFVVDVGAGADYTIFPFGTFNMPSRIARANAQEYANKHLRPKQISHEIYIVESQEDFDAMIAKRNISKLQAKVWRIENELAQAKRDLKEAKKAQVLKEAKK